MERAGEGLAALVAEVAPDGRIAVVCGKGNNGGDGLVAARLLRGAWRDVRVLLLSDELSGDPAANLARLEGGWEPLSPGRLDGAAVVVDCVLGTGFEGVPRDGALSAIEAINAAGVPVVSADVPSGVDASTGEVAGAAVRATATATFAAAKPGLWVAPGKAHAGAVRVVDIGIPEGGPGEPDTGLIGPGAVAGLPRREPGGTKFVSGHVLVCGGSRGLTGAPCLAAEAAMRAGAGYVTACVPADLEPIFEARLLEVMTVGLDGGSEARAAAVLERATRGALVVGPGWGAATTRRSSRARSPPAPRSRSSSTPTGSTPTRGGSRTFAAARRPRS